MLRAEKVGGCVNTGWVSEGGRGERDLEEGVGGETKRWGYSKVV